jgi:hypothetical protein
MSLEEGLEFMLLNIFVWFILFYKTSGVSMTPPVFMLLQAAVAEPKAADSNPLATETAVVWL